MPFQTHGPSENSLLSVHLKCEGRTVTENSVNQVTRTKNMGASRIRFMHSSLRTRDSTCAFCAFVDFLSQLIFNKVSGFWYSRMSTLSWFLVFM